MSEFIPKKGEKVFVSLDSNVWEVIPKEFLCMDEGQFVCKDSSIKNVFRSWPCIREIKEVLPKDILCRVWEDDFRHSLRRYSDGSGKFYQNGSTSLTKGILASWKNYRVLENDPQPWFGGECPIPKGINYRVFIGSTWHRNSLNNVQIDWNWSWEKEPSASRITAYQILGEIDGH